MSISDKPLPLTGATTVEPKAPIVPVPTPSEVRAYTNDMAIDISFVITDPIRDALANIYSRIQRNQLAKRQELEKPQTSEVAE